MSDDPFADEEQRREALFQEVTFEDLHELQAEDIEVGKKQHQDALDELTDIKKTPTQRIEDILRKTKVQTYGDWEAEEREAKRNHAAIGGWSAGNDKQEHQSVRFEIEAERALFLGKPVPTDPELAAKHASLAALHVRYQKTGDPSLLIGIADMQAEYQAMLNAYTQARGDR